MQYDIRRTMCAEYRRERARGRTRERESERQRESERVGRAMQQVCMQCIHDTIASHPVK
jgi:hypothetical protein